MCLWGSLTRPSPGAYTPGKTSSVVFHSSLYSTYQNWIIYIIYICITFNNECKLIAHVVSLAVIVLRLSDHFKRLNWGLSERVVGCIHLCPSIKTCSTSNCTMKVQYGVNCHAKLFFGSVVTGVDLYVTP